jgi:hypothetical protein
VVRGLGAARIWGSGRSLGLGYAIDGIFVSGSGIETVQAWSVTAGAEHRWNPQWRTSIYGGYYEFNYSGTAAARLCASPAVNFTVTNCDPDFGNWVIGTRTQWNPHPYLDIGLDVYYSKLLTAFGGVGTTLAADGARVAGPVAIEDQETLTLMGRIQYNFLP